MKMRKVGDEAPAASWLRRSGSISEQRARKRQVFWHRQMSHCPSRNIHLRCPLQLGGVLGDPRDLLGMAGAGRAPSSRGRVSKSFHCSWPPAMGGFTSPPQGCPLRDILCPCKARLPGSPSLLGSSQAFLVTPWTCQPGF